VAAHLLSLCTEERTCEQLAGAMSITVRRVEALCDQLRWKGLLEAGLPLPPPTWPGVSIVIPSYNRAKELERCVRSLFTLDYPAGCLEIIVVDDASTDETGSMLERLVEEAVIHDLVMHVVRHEKRQGVGISRNTGAEAAHYELIAYLDSDCVASLEWLRELVPAFQDTRLAAVGGMIRAYDRHTLLGRYEDVCSSLYMGNRFQQLSLKGPLTYLPTANMLVRRTAWEQLAGFAPMAQGEDVDFCRRLLMSGARMNYVPQGVIYHDYRTSLASFLHIRAAYASAEAALIKRYPVERRILLLPAEQALFAAVVIGGAWSITWLSIWNGFQGRAFAFAFFAFLFAVLLLLSGTFKRIQKVRKLLDTIAFPIVFKATLRADLAYVYHLSRHLTRYYTLPLLVFCLFVAPLFAFLLVMWSIVVGVDYVRFRPEMDLGRYALCSLLNDCTYEVGVVWGCLKHRTWKPLLPLIKASL
jgi:mycofactocin system glycosyltransferase